MSITPALQIFFRKQLSNWHINNNDRELPWKEEKDPYKIWLSEIILQQTRAQQGLPYYINFINKYPTIQTLAAADDEDVFRLWQGLGYYNRCKNMLATARYVTKECNGIFPNTYDSIIQLKGIGPYTAAAIASFAYGLPNAVVDGNVYRIVARFGGIDTPFDSAEGKKLFAEIAQILLDKSDSAQYNQAIMDLGATICTPANPQCEECPLQLHCVALKRNIINLLPIRSKKVTVRERFFNFLILIHNGTVWIEQRKAGDIWENLHQPYLIETENAVENDILFASNEPNANFFPIDMFEYNGQTKQRLTHQIINSKFYTVNLTDKPKILNRDGKWISISKLKKLAFPKTLVSFLENNLYF